MSSMKVLFALGLILESLGLDVGVSRLLLTFLMQCVYRPSERPRVRPASLLGQIAELA